MAVYPPSILPESGIIEKTLSYYNFSASKDQFTALGSGFEIVIS